MIIEISNEYRIATDDMQFIVQKMSITQAGVNTKAENIGKEVWKDIAYCSNIKFALKFIGKNILLVNNDLDIIVTKLNLLDIKIEAIKEQLENTRIDELLKVKKVNKEEDFMESEEY